MSNTASAEAGQAVYSKKVLSIYDIGVLGFSSSFLWRCPTKLLRQEFVANATDNHLDVGVGTGYYLDKCLSNVDCRLALLDLNQNSLDATAARVSRFNPEIYNANVLEPIDLDCEKFDSISVNYLLHCLPGDLIEKAVLFKNLKPLLNDGGVIFGSTILGRGEKVGYFAKKLMAFYNSKGIFGNSQDSLVDLKTSLDENFSDVNIWVKGCVAVFTAKI